MKAPGLLRQGLRLLALLAPLAAHGLPVPALQLGLQSSWTDNLLGDSLALADLGGTLSLRLNQPLSPLLGLEAGGRLTRLSDHGELGEANHTLQLNLGAGGPLFESLWAQAGWFRQHYQDDYDLYDRDRLFVVLGARRRQGGRLLLRGQFLASATRFPSVPDSLDADYRDLSLALGANLALDLPLALDLESGVQLRRYRELDPPVDTPWLWTSLRLSRPLGERTGLRLLTSRRWQLAPGADDLLSLTESGLDPGELLWDGWQVEAGLQRLGRRWRSSLTVGWLAADYAAEPGRSARRDESLQTALACSRIWSVGTKGWQLQASLEGTWRRTDSSLTYYGAITRSLAAGLTLRTP